MISSIETADLDVVAIRNRELHLEPPGQMISHLPAIFNVKVAFVDCLDNLAGWICEPCYTVAAPANNIFFVSACLFRQ